MKITHTFIELEISKEAYLEIYSLLAEAGYHRLWTFIHGVIDMDGIVLVMKENNDSRENDSINKSQEKDKSL